MQKTQIQYADFVTNPLRAQDAQTGNIGWACIRTNHGCDHCWAEVLNQRFGTHRAYDTQNMQRVIPYLDQREFDKWTTFNPRGHFKHDPLFPYVFAFDMTDFLLPAWEQWLPRLLYQMGTRSDIRWLLLTKRADRLPVLLSNRYVPARNIFIGLTIPYEDDRTEEAISKLFDVSLAGWSTWISHEPCLGPVAWPGYMDFISFMATGGESGSQRRPPQLKALQHDRDWCVSHHVPFFFKQLGEPGEKHPALLDGVSWQQMPRHYQDVSNTLKLAGVTAF